MVVAGTGSASAHPIKWHGGKHFLAKRIIELMPPHVHYVEPYFGGGAVLFAKDPEGVSEVVNDLNEELMGFWSVLAFNDLFTPFLKLCQSTPFSQPLFERCKEFRCGAPEDDADRLVKRAFATFVTYRQSRQGLGKDFATLSRNRTRRGMNEQVSAWLTAIEGLPEAHERLKRVVILNDDAIKVIRQQDGHKTHFYIDPPYMHTTRNQSATDAYEHEMTVMQHNALLKALGNVRGTFQLSGYHSDLYDDVADENDWQCVEFDLPNNASGLKTKERKTECLWMNYQP